MSNISVIIPLYNKEKAISNTIQSVLNQTYTDFELIIIDDGSTDKSGKIAKEYAKVDQRIRYFRKDNGGVSSARNLGVQLSQSQWVTFLDADDELLPNNLEVLTNLISKFKVQIATANFYTFDGKQKTPRINDSHNEKVIDNFIKAMIKKEAYFGSGATIFNKSILGEKPYNENLSRYEDAEFELNLFNRYPIAISTTPVIIYHREFAELSKTRHDFKEKDFIFNMNFKNKSFWQKIKMGEYIREGITTYKETKLLKEKYGINFYYGYIYQNLVRYYNLLNKIRNKIR